MEIKFNPRTSHRSVWPFYAVLTFFLVIFILILPLEEEPMLVVVYGLIVLVFMIVFVQASAWFYGYYLNDDGLILKHYTRKVIPYEQIKKIQIISGEETGKLLEVARRKEVIATNEMDIIGALKGQMDFGKLIQYCSYQIVNQDSKMGRKITKVKSYTKGDFVVLVTWSDNMFLLSPKDPEGLITEVSKKIHKKSSV